MVSFNCVKTNIYINLKDGTVQNTFAWERFDIISTIMPYYAHTHKAFLLMSQLYSASRNKLDEYFDEFISCISEYWMSLVVNFKSETKTWNLPNDLFDISISMIDTSLIDNFVSNFTKSIYHNSWYFNSHNMHSRIKIKNPICVIFFWTEGLYPHVDTLK